MISTVGKKPKNNKMGFPMKNVVKAVSCLAFSILSATTMAQEGPKWWEGFYVGGSYGTAVITSGAHINTPEDGTNAVDPPETGAGVVALPIDFYSKKQKPGVFEFLAGYEFRDVLSGNVGVEMRASNTLAETVHTFVDVSSSALGLYGTYRAGDNAYFKALFGLASSSFDVSGDVSLSESAGNYSYGIAFGQKIFGGALEIMYMRYPDVKLEDENRSHDFTIDYGSGPKNSSIRFNKRIKFETLSFGYVYSF